MWIRKIVSVVVTICIIVKAFVGLDIVQAEDLRDGDYEYNVLDDGTVEITEYKGADSVIDIPNQINGKSVSSIKSDAIINNYSLEEVKIPFTVTNLACRFSCCRNLKAINVDSNNPNYLSEDGILFNKKKTTLFKYPEGKDGEYIIPNCVIEIGEHAFQLAGKLTSVTIPDSVCNIGNGAFFECDSLKEIVIPDDIANINRYTFAYCKNLTEVMIPSSVKSIGYCAFIECTNLASVTIPVSVTEISDAAFYKCNRLKDVYYSGVKTQWDQIKVGNAGVTGGSGNTNEALSNAVIHFSDGTTLNGPEKDYSYQILDDGTIEITGYIGSDTVVVVPAEINGKYVTSISEDAFINDAKLLEITIPFTVNNLGKHIFSSCQNLRSIHVDANNTSYASEDGVLFNKDKTKLIKYPEGKTGNYVIPYGVISIGECAFFVSWNLTGITIPSSVTEIGKKAFFNCVNLKEINLPVNRKKIDEDAFACCSGLTTITLPYGLEIINMRSFRECSNLSSITIPISVTEIKNAAFYQCNSLKDVYYSGTKAQWDKINIETEDNEKLVNATVHYVGVSSKDYDYKILDDKTIEITKYKGSDEVVKIPAELDEKSVVKIGSDTFCHNECIKEIFIPLSVSEVEGTAFEYCPNLSSFLVDPLNECYTSEDGILFNKQKTELIKYPEKKSGNIYRIPSDVAGIGTSAFFGCINLTEISIPNDVTKLGISAFEDCTNLLKVNIPNSMTKIGDCAFGDCESMVSIDIPDGVTDIGNSTFDGCRSLREIRLPESITSIKTTVFAECVSLEEISIPTNVTSIEEQAFWNCKNLKKINLPDSVYSLGNSVFYGCIDLTEISIPTGLKSIEKRTFYNCNNLRDIYYAGTKEQWDKIEIDEHGNESLLKATIHFKEEQTQIPPEETILSTITAAKQELELLKSGNSLSIAQDFQHYLSPEQIGIMEDYIYTWLAEINYVYKYSGSSSVKECIMKKVGIDPEGDFTAAVQQAITHISVETKYGQKTFQITLDIGNPDSSGNLYPVYGNMRYDVISKESIPSDVPTNGLIEKSSSMDLGPFVESVCRATDNSLHSTYQWQSLNDEMTAGVLIDKTVVEIVGNKNGSYLDTVFTVYAKPLYTYSKKVIIACPVDVFVYGMDGKEAGSIVDNKPNGGDYNVRLDVVGDSKTVYLTGDDYYISLRGTDTGTMNYTIEEIANEQVNRTVKFLELQLRKDLEYTGYVFKPLNIDKDLYALKTTKGQDEFLVINPDSDTYESAFKKIKGLTLNRSSTTLGKNRNVQLNVGIFPEDASNKSLKWSSGNGSVASVDSSGLVTAVGVGETTITVSTQDGSRLSASCIVVVADSSSSESQDPGQNQNPDQDQNQIQEPETEKPSDPQPGPVVVNLFYIVGFDANGGTNLSRKTMTLLNDDTLGILPKVQRKNYTFSGWYSQRSGGMRVTSDTVLPVATTLYARWSEVVTPTKVASLTLKSPKSGQVKASYQKVNGAKGYQIVYSTNKNFTSAKAVSASTTAKTIQNLKKGSTYYVKVRAYKLDSVRNKIYGAYSAVKKIKL